MNSLLDIFHAFSDCYTKTNGWDSPASVWFWDNDQSEWQCVEQSYDDPYNLLPTLVVHGYHGKAMYVVHGWAAPYEEPDKYTGEYTRPSQHPEKMRVRSFTYLNGESILNSYQFMGKPIEEVQTNPEGAIVDSIVLTIHKMKNYLANKEVYYEQS